MAKIFGNRDCYITRNCVYLLFIPCLYIITEYCYKKNFKCLGSLLKNRNYIHEEIIFTLRQVQKQKNGNILQPTK